MKKIFLWTITLLVCVVAVYAQQVPVDSLARMPMTDVQRAMLKIDNPDDLKSAYDTLKSPYDQRYFLNALPGYFKIRKIAAIPGWVSDAVVAGMKSDDPLLVNESARLAGILNLDFTQELMNLYKTVHNNFGCNENMLKNTILTSMGRIVPSRTAKISAATGFYYEILGNDPPPPPSAERDFRVPGRCAR